MKNTKKNAFASVFISCIIFITFITITSCGGEEPEHPDDENNDEIAVTDDEPVDNEQPDDVTDEENPDGDQVVIANCEKLLDIVGDWVSINMPSEYKMTLAVAGALTDCEVAVQWTQGLSGLQKWHGLELPLTLWDEESYLNMTLKKTGENLVREDTGKNGEPAGEIILQKIQ